MKTFKHLKFLAVLVMIATSMTVKGQLVISQLLTGSIASAIEIYNTDAVNSITLTSANFAVQVSVDNKSQNIASWSPTAGSDIILGPREVLVVVGAGSQLAAFTSYLDNIGATYVDASSTLSFVNEDAFQISYAASGSPSPLDRVGQWLSSQAKPTGNGGPSIDNINYERDLEFLLSGDPNFNRAFNGTGGTYQQLSLLNATGGYNADDFEGFGIPPANIKYNGTNWYTPATPGGSTTEPNITTTCVVEVLENQTATVGSSKNVKDLLLKNGSSVTLAANNSGYSQAKKVKRTRGTGTIKAQKYLGTDGWHLIGTPFPDGFANSEGRGANALYWYWNGAGWTQGTAGAGGVPAGLGLMVRVGSAYSYSYTGGGAGTITTGNGGASDPYSSFTWDRTGNADGDLQYLSDGHSSVSQGSGWNLLSNPFTCALDWNLIYDNGGTTNIDATVYIWDPATDGWITYNAASNAGTGVQDGLIPPYGAFLIKVSSDAPASISVNVDSDGSLTVPSSSYNKYSSYDSDVLHIGIKDVASSASGFYMVSDYPQGTSTYDSGLDTWSKATVGDNAPDIFQTDGNYGEISQNLTNLSVAQSISLETADLSAGKTYQISVEQFVDGNNYHVSLEDTYTNTMTDLTSAVYTFTQPSEMIDDRFIIHINQNTVSVEETEVQTHYSYVLNNSIYINPGDLKINAVNVYSIDGKLISRSDAFSTTTEICTLNTTGIYILEIISDQGIFKDKVSL